MRHVALAIFLTVSTAAAQETDRPWLGVHVAPLTAESRAAFQVPADVTSGIILQHIEKGSAAERAGLRMGDVLLSFGDKTIDSIDALVEGIRSHKVGDSVSYKVRRRGGSIEGTLTLGKRPPQPKAGPPPRPLPARPDARGNLDSRLDKVAKDIEELRRRALAGQKKKRKPTASGKKPRGFNDWVRREEQGLKAASKRGDQKAVAYHKARLGLLRELRQANAAPAPRRNQAGNLGKRLNQLERKLDAILERLEKSMK
ncbi:MAG: S1C family serine protease [Planctomycetota bacterium]|jgi:membrane-associated protease RseP (regulator of RpoE activity)